MTKNPTCLRQRFSSVIINKWKQNNHNLSEISCVYAILSFDVLTKSIDIEYIGSTTNLFRRYKSHKVPEKVQALGKINLLYYLPMNKGFYDYEMKLIKKTQPRFNKQHK